MGHHVQSFGGAGEHFGGEYPHMHGQYPQMAGAYGQMTAPQHWYGQDWYQHPPAAPFDYRFSQGYIGLCIRSTSIIDTSYFYFGLVLGCIDADLCM